MGLFSTSRPSGPLFFLFLQVNVCVLEVNERVLQLNKASPRLTPYRLGVQAVAHRLASPYRFKNLGLPFCHKQQHINSTKIHLYFPIL